MSGTVGGTTYGVAKQVTIHPVRVLDCNGSGSNSGVIAGVNWVTANRQLPAVANMSLGGGASSALDTAVANSIAAGVTYAIAAGNDNQNACNYSPARTASRPDRGATTSTDARASYSNYGTCLDIFAPGSSITSAWYTGSSATAVLSGTSMATPHVAGAAALYLAANPVRLAGTGCAGADRRRHAQQGDKPGHRLAQSPALCGLYRRWHFPDRHADNRTVDCHADAGPTDADTHLYAGLNAGRNDNADRNPHGNAAARPPAPTCSRTRALKAAQ